MSERELELLYLRLEKPIYNVVYRWVWSAEEAQDIVQEAFVKLWRMRDRVEPATADALAYRIALNLAASRRRKEKIRRWLPLDAASFFGSKKTVQDQLEADERRTLLRSAILALPEALRRVVLLCEFSDMSYEAVAATLRIPVGTVGSRRNRAIRTLREALARSSTDPIDERPPRPVADARPAAGRADPPAREDRRGTEPR